MATAITITDLTRAARQYKNDFEMLPYAVLGTVLAEHGITLFPGVQYKNTIVSTERKQGIAMPYGVDESIVNRTVGKFTESDLIVLSSVACVKDNIRSYQQVEMIKPNEMLGANKTKKHPFHVQMMMDIIKTFGEDLLDALFPGERDVSDTTPLGCFDGFETIILAAITAGDVTGGKGNYLESGTFAAPASESDTNALDYLVTWLRGANVHLKKNSTLMIPASIAEYVKDAFSNKYRYKDVTSTALEAYLKDRCNMRNLKIVISNYMGTGDRLILTAPNNFDFGMNTKGDEKFVQVRNPYEDPNYVQYWIQGDYGCRIRSVHEKMFFTNDGSLAANRLSGDYS